MSEFGSPISGTTMHNLPGTGQDILRKWFAVYTTPRHEKRVAEHFAVREVEHFLPLYRAQHKWKNGCRVAVELPLFPNYIFVHISRRERVRVLESPGTLAIVSRAGQPLPLPECDIDTLRNGVHLRQTEPHPYLTVGTRARIVRGPLAGMEGVLLRKKSDLRVVLTLDQIRQSIAVEVDGDEVEPMGAPLTPHN